ncbi:hypothetical protein EP331_11075 [bacterium]|nr:MAG: hypothetical protein EP331_11075 [bacterium]
MQKSLLLSLLSLIVVSTLHAQKLPLSGFSVENLNSDSTTITAWGISAPGKHVENNLIYAQQMATILLNAAYESSVELIEKMYDSDVQEGDLRYVESNYDLSIKVSFKSRKPNPTFTETYTLEDGSVLIKAESKIPSRNAYYEAEPSGKLLFNTMEKFTNTDSSFSSSYKVQFGSEYLASQKEIKHESSFFPLRDLNKTTYKKPKKDSVLPDWTQNTASVDGQYLIASAGEFFFPGNAKKSQLVDAFIKSYTLCLKQMATYVDSQIKTMTDENSIATVLSTDIQFSNTYVSRIFVATVDSNPRLYIEVRSKVIAH